jgi:hypothetical protein
MLSAMQTSLPLSQRPIDQALIGFFILNLLFVTYGVSGEQIYILDPDNPARPFWPPNFMVDAIHWYGRNFDPLLMARPAWWRATIWLDNLCFGPYYLAATYAFWKGKAWIRLPSVIYATMMLTNVSIIMFEEIWGPHATPNFPAVLGANLGWIVVPIVVLLRVWPRRNPFEVKWR